MPDQPKPSWRSLPIEQRFRAATDDLTHEECMRVLPLVKAWVARKEREYATDPSTKAQGGPARSNGRIRIGNKSY